MLYLVPTKNKTARISWFSLFLAAFFFKNMIKSRKFFIFLKLIFQKSFDNLFFLYLNF